MAHTAEVPAADSAEDHAEEDLAEVPEGVDSEAAREEDSAEGREVSASVPDRPDRLAADFGIGTVGRITVEADALADVSEH